MAPTISVSNQRKSKCRRSQRRTSHHSVSSSSSSLSAAAAVSVINYGRVQQRRSCWSVQRSPSLALTAKTAEQGGRTEPIEIDENAMDGSMQIAMEPQRRQSTCTVSESESSSSGCSSAYHSTEFHHSTQYCRCESLNMSDFDDDGFTDDQLNYPTRLELWMGNTWQRSGGNTKGLLDIAIKTIKLIQRNQLLQAKLAQLQAETHAFIASVMANPENRDAKSPISTESSSFSSPPHEQT
ncbi:uncharacterized protein DMENIID0001_165540 [Sergentomyia squamirostris]